MSDERQIIATVAWHVVGLAAAITGAGMLWGWPGAMLIFGAWAMIGTALDLWIHAR